MSTETFVKVTGIIGMYISFLIVWVTFLNAYFFNDYRYSININVYGEAHIELALTVFMFCFFTYALIVLLKGYRKV